jgi:hypothetical protein
MHPRRQRAKGTILGALIALPLLFLAIDRTVENALPEWDDYERGVLFSRLRSLRAAEPDRPWLAILGTSRSANGFDARTLSENESGLLVFNASLLGSTPLTNLLALRRLVEEGHRPNEVVVEILPLMMHQMVLSRKGRPLDLARIRAVDLPLVAQLEPYSAGRMAWSWAEANTFRAATYRADLAAQAWPAFAPGDRVSLRSKRETIIDSHGQCALQMDPVPEETYHRGFEVARKQYQKPLSELTEVNSTYEHAMRALVSYCQSQNIRVRALIFMPESSAFRAFYGPGVEKFTYDYMRDLCAQWDIPLVDARSWCPDDCFIDGHHLTLRGSQHFSRRFHAEVLAPREPLLPLHK